MPGRYYALYAGAALAVIAGVLLLSVSLAGLGYEWAGRVLSIVTLSAVAGIATGYWIHFVRVQLRRLDGEIEYRILDARLKAELAERGRRLRFAQERMAELTAQEEAKRIQSERQAWQDAQVNAFVYFIIDRQRQVVKIGVSQFPQKRLASLQTSNPNPLELALFVTGGYPLEKSLHERYAANRLSGEWFQLTEEIVAEIESRKA